MYPEQITTPMRQELTAKGFTEYTTAEDCLLYTSDAADD